MTDEQIISQRCSFCRGVWHPATGHWYSDRARACGPCTLAFWRWMRWHTGRKWGGQWFYELRDALADDGY